jgi:hypothetical protein
MKQAGADLAEIMQMELYQGSDSLDMLESYEMREIVPF